MAADRGLCNLADRLHPFWGASMRRRDFISGGIIAATSLISSPALVQPAPRSPKGAVIIGVNKAGQLPTLSAAVSGANAVAAWLQSEGFEVKLFSDERAPVRAAALFDAISEFVDRGTLEQLVVYFSGHGFLNGFNEYWMLSNAPQNPNEAVSLTESVYLARESAIPNVVFISDACRSTPDSINAARVRGSLIFPNAAISRNIRPDVDQFLAALPGQAAAEIPVSQSTAGFEGIFTACLLSAFREPVDSLIKRVGDVDVIPNRNLKIFLEGEVVKRAEAKALRLHQRPDAQVVSSDQTYIARVRRTVAPSNTVSLSPTIRDVALAELASAGADLTPRTSRTNYLVRSANNLDAASLGFSKAQQTISDGIRKAKLPEAQSVATHPGFTVSGQLVTEAVAARNARMTIENFDSPGRTADRSVIRVEFRDAPAVSVAMKFADGSGCVLAALRNHQCSVVVQEQGVTASYVEIGTGPDPQIDSLRATVAAAAQFGVFRIDGERETINRKAAEFGDRIRQGKGADPTLGIYAAYAYSQADLTDRVRSVDDYMRNDLGVRLFDVAMLSRRLSTDRNRTGVSPFCPMLTQGWGLLRVTQTSMPPAVDRLRDFILPGLWTRFDAEGMGIVMTMLKNGDVQ